MSNPAFLAYFSPNHSAPYAPFALITLENYFECQFLKFSRDIYPLLWENAFSRAIGAAGAQVPYKHKVGGSNPSSPTIEKQRLPMAAFSFPSKYIVGFDFTNKGDIGLIRPRLSRRRSRLASRPAHHQHAKSDTLSPISKGTFL